MQVIFLTFVDGGLMEVDTLFCANGCDLNATAREILEGYMDIYIAREFCCSFYLVAGERLAFAGEERGEGEGCED